jgi:phosphate transport system substrate-binding protein
MNKALLLAFVGLLMPTPALSETARLEIVGTGDGLEILSAMADHYSKANPQVRVEAPPSIGSGGGIAAVGSGRAVLGRIARELTEVEREAGIVYTPIARMPSAFFTHPNVKVKSISTKQLADIYAGRIINWKDLGGPDHAVRVIRREDIDSTLVVLRNTMPGWKSLVLTERSKIALTTQDSIETARKVAGAIGFAPYSKDLENELLVLEIDGVHPLHAAYPSHNVLALIHMERTLTGAATDFLKFSLSSRAQTIISDYGGVPATRW